MSTPATQPRTYCVAALYRFVGLPDFAQLKPSLLQRMQQLDLCGTLLLANEGINGTIAGTELNIDALLNWLRTDERWHNKLAEIEVKKSWTDTKPFHRCKVKLKKEIVTLGVTGIDPKESVGTYVEPKDWNDLISDPDVVTIDTRNDYETKIGKFKGAVDPGTKTFREFPGYAQRELDPQKNKKVAMYCTGGIRCEKSTAYMKSLGFEEVYHLKGGILKYLEEVPQEDSLWEGECFVFDERVAVDHDLEPGQYVQCHACRMPLDADDLKSEHYVPGESCSYCHESVTPEQRERFREREKQIRLAAERGEEHIGEGFNETRERRRQEKQQLKAAQRKQQ